MLYRCRKIFLIQFRLLVFVLMVALMVFVTYQASASKEAYGDFGDAPDSHWYGVMTSYDDEANVVVANFPTIYAPENKQLWTGPYHRDVASIAYLGEGVDDEWNTTGAYPTGDTNLIPGQDVADLDDQDDGIGYIYGLEDGCTKIDIWYTVTVVGPEPKPLFINVWFDFNRDGDWEDGTICHNAFHYEEWVVQDKAVLVNGPGTYVLRVSGSIPAVDSELRFEPMWMRMTLSPERQGVQRPFDGSGPLNGYAYGETEDYLLNYRDDGDPQAGWSG